MASPATPTDPSQTLPFADPTATLVGASSLDFLLIELVPMAYRITADLAAREEEWMRGSGSKPARSDVAEETGSVAGTTGRGGTVGGDGTVVDEEEAREAVFNRLETLGYRVGLGVVERFSRDKPRPTTPLDIIKFLCKDLWILLFRKQIDNLKTNHRGIYVLTDNTFKPLSRMSFDTKKFDNVSHTSGAGVAVGGGTGSVLGGEGIAANSLARAQPFLYFPAGVIRGSLAALGIQATVQAETSGLPGATFQIRTLGAKP
ncbi:transport protein particle component [Lophiotrema nucula]|uniref:Transport protein particle component n=1 Tax=Lophiotrema nucula TaxID=690887 RepID=A0A6A5YKN5_9PLEO|nr:transport protein particle component [Lophiotrema nucula]